MSKTLDLSLKFRRYHSFRDINISGLGGHIAISGCWWLSQSLADTFFQLSMVVNPRFAVGISMLSVIVSDFVGYLPIDEKPGNTFLDFAVAETPGFPFKFRPYLSYFRRYKEIPV